MLILASARIVIAAIAIAGDRLIIVAGAISRDRLVIRLCLIASHGLIVAALNIARGADRLRTRVAARRGRVVAGRHRRFAAVTADLEHIAPGGTDRFGIDWFAEIKPDGTQVWAHVRGGKITNGGVNLTPRRRFDLDSIP